MARCAVTARVQRAERTVKDVRITAYVAPLNAAPDGAARHPYPGADAPICRKEFFNHFRLRLAVGFYPPAFEGNVGPGVLLLSGRHAQCRL